MEAIAVQGLTKRYGEVVAVDRISFSVGEGELFGFLGPNGAGKTTTVRILTGIIRPDGGLARIKGFPAGSLKAKQLAGVVPEMANPYNDLSGWENLMLMASLYGVPRRAASARGERLLGDLGLLERKASPVRTYSKGMKQRLILAMALVSEPEVLFLDEPTSGLDVQSARLIRELLRGLKAQGKTIFLTTHDMDEANQLCDRVAIINKGRLVAIDPPAKLRLAASGLQSVEVSFAQADGLNPAELARLPGVSEVERVGDKCRLYTDDPGELVVALVNYACSAGLKIVLLNTLAPSLEEAFLALTEKEGSDG
ncbi:MAG: ATP-binding cassette domain-containing protein [Candidatus Acetothermia bacterium]|jgi:ABC-2 type transport system ATP-binding protein|nr:ATP-binding cassette domain-containing protein [Candidatus Acetothermia bacterium]MDH7505491.1 ATP-binding cassette domain-containing protein [Candidatus Acetothermia bacterium]